MSGQGGQLRNLSANAPHRPEKRDGLAGSVEVVFADVSPERAALRPMAMARADVILAWQSLNDRREPARALSYLDRAVRRWPPLRRTVEYWRLRGAATALRASGPKGYAVLRSANAGVRRVRARLGR